MSFRLSLRPKNDISTLYILQLMMNTLNYIIVILEIGWFFFFFFLSKSKNKLNKGLNVEYILVINILLAIDNNLYNIFLLAKYMMLAL